MSANYPSDVTDGQWQVIRYLLPKRAKVGRRPLCRRWIVNAILYVNRTGCQWRYLPKDLPPKSMVHDYLTRWNHDGTLERIHHVLYVQLREAACGAASPTACVIDSQSVKSAEKGALASTRTASMPAS